MRQQLVQGLVCWRVKCQMPLLQYGDTDFLLRVLDFHVPVGGEMILLDSSATLLLQQAGTAYEEQGYVARATRLLAKWQHTKPLAYLLDLSSSHRRWLFTFFLAHGTCRGIRRDTAGGRLWLALLLARRAVDSVLFSWCQARSAEGKAVKLHPVESWSASVEMCVPKKNPRGRQDSKKYHGIPSPM